MRVPGERPHIQPPISPKEANKPQEAKPEEQASKPIPAPKEGFTKGPELDSRAIAVRMAALAHEAKEKEFSFEEIIQRAIDETGSTNPQAAMEEANRKIQKEIDDVLVAIKENKELMEEAEAWQEFANILEQELSEEQVSGFLDVIKDSIRSL